MLSLMAFSFLDIAEKNDDIILSLCCFLKRHFSTWRLLKGAQVCEYDYVQCRVRHLTPTYVMTNELQMIMYI